MRAAPGAGPAAAYNSRAMLDALANLLAPAVLERLTLVLNHVIGAEPAAKARLAPHAGRVLVLELAGWPKLLPAPRGLAWRISPAGLLEWCGLDATADAAGLTMCVDASNPAAWMAKAIAGVVQGDRPAVQVSGDAQLAAEVGWLLDNVRWDVAAELERTFGPLVGAQLHRAGSALGRGLRAALRALAPLAERFGRR
jgi:ubiquinone biosynthesis protein UbiJ